MQNFQLLYTFICSIYLNQVFSLTYCPPLTAPKETNLTCLSPDETQGVDCSAGWLPDGTVSYYECSEGPLSLKRSGRIVCKGYIEAGNNSVQTSEENYILPCGIRPNSAASEFHFFDNTKSPHFPVLNVTDADEGDFRDVGLKLLNLFRQKHQVPALNADELLNQKAQTWADHLALRNYLDMATENAVGQNLYHSDQTDLKLAVNDGVQYWYTKGLESYNWTNLKSNWENPLSLDFSQIVWKSTNRVGLGAANTKTNDSIVVAFFFPMGNIVLEDEDSEKLFVENVLPLNNNSTFKLK